MNDGSRPIKNNCWKGVALGRLSNDSSLAKTRSKTSLINLKWIKNIISQEKLSSKNISRLEASYWVEDRATR